MFTVQHFCIYVTTSPAQSDRVCMSSKSNNRFNRLTQKLIYPLIMRINILFNVGPYLGNVFSSNVGCILEIFGSMKIDAILQVLKQYWAILVTGWSSRCPNAVMRQILQYWQCWFSTCVSVRFQQHSSSYSNWFYFESSGVWQQAMGPSLPLSVVWGSTYELFRFLFF